jgi:hypothetical protein
MAVGKRGTRRINVGGKFFRWRCEFHDPSEQFSSGYAEHGKTWTPDTLLIRPESQPRRQLSVTWPACTGPVVTPQFVRDCIEAALQRGWPAASEVLELSESDILAGEN